MGIFDSFVQQQKKQAGETGFEANEARAARVETSEIADFLLKDLLPQIRKTLTERSVGNLLLIECPFDFEHPIGMALHEAGVLSYHTQVRQVIAEDGRPMQQEVKSPAFHSIPWTHLAQEQQRALTDQIGSVLADQKNFFLLARTKAQLPSALQSMVRCTYRINRFDPSSFVNACETFFDNAKGKVSLPDGENRWIRHVAPVDFLVNTAVADDEIVSEIRESVSRRIDGLSDIPRGMPLSSWSGLEHIKSWVGELQQALVTGERAFWQLAGRGALFEGSPLINKGEIARSVADACGLSFLNTSTHSWIDNNPLACLSEQIQRARDHAPALLFIEGMDLLQLNELQATDVQTAALRRQLHPLVDLIGQFDVSAPVVIIGSVGQQVEINPLLMQPGRLERTFVLPDYSNEDAAARLKHLVSSLEHTISEDEFARLGRYADPRKLSVYVAHGYRQARAKKEKLAYGHLRDAMILGIREFEPSSEKNTPETRLRDELVAYHEAGHGALRLLLGREGWLNVEYMTIRPGAGYGGFMLPAAEADDFVHTYQDYINDIWVSFGGRIAEAIQYGEGRISGGAGGGAGSDLAHVTERTIRMFCLFGMPGQAEAGQCDNLILFPIGSLSEGLAISGMKEKVEAFLRAQYIAAYAKLKQNWPLVESIAQALLTHKILDAEQIQALLSDYRDKHPA